MSKVQIFASLLLAIIAINFWTGSRYPRLNAKAAMAGELPLSETLSFERVVEYDESAPIHEKFFYSLINWIATNKKGMMFGFLFGAAYLTLLSTLRWRPTNSIFKNSLIGTFTGAPLGVCVNCAAPIANAVYKALGKIEISLATMISSPTLNVVILTMLFSVFPIQFVIIKIGFTLLTLLVVIPIISKSFPAESTLEANCEIEPLPKIPLPNGWIKSVFFVAKSFLKNLAWIVIATGPLMIVAGALGAALTQVVNLQDYMHGFSLLSLIIVAFVGTFLPAPIALDVILAQAFLIAGVDEAYIMALLFTLGIYSVYSCFIIWKSISRNVALAMYACVVLLGIGAGLTAKLYQQYNEKSTLDFIDKEFTAIFNFPSAYAAAASFSPSNFEVIPNDSRLSDQKNGVLIFQDNQKPRNIGNSNAAEFTQVWAEKIGIYRPIEFSILDFFTPFHFSRGMTSGDFNNDGWDDFAIACEDGIRVYRSIAGKKFVETHITAIEGLTGQNIMLAAFVDINNDGWLDLLGSSYGRGELFFLENKRGTFSKVATQIPNPGAITTNAISFADIDRDGDLDLAIGNWYMGFSTKEPPIASRNYILLNNQNKFKVKALPGVPGETLSALFSDYNSDGHIDLAVGNDFSRPDIFYVGNSKGAFKQIFKNQGIPHTTKFTMSIDTADINNDLKLDMYMAQITGNFDKSEASDYEDYGPDYCKGIDNSRDRKICLENIAAKDIMVFQNVELANVKKCKSLNSKQRVNDCMAQVIMLSAIKQKRPDYCKKIPKRYTRNHFMCDRFFGYESSNRNEDLPYVKQIEKRNVLLLAEKDGQFVDKGKKMNVDITGWSWNAKFSDLNNDSWQDLYVANGFWMTPKRYNNAIFLNVNGKTFKQPENGFGLHDTMDVASYLYTDFDNDGDVDILSSPVNGPLKMFVNNNRSGKSITFSLRDLKGNSHCIGCKIYIGYDGDFQQIREIKGGGGFQSFDAAKAHFGLGKRTGVQSVKIEWSDGEKWVYDRPLKANSHYYILRNK